MLCRAEAPPPEPLSAYSLQQEMARRHSRERMMVDRAAKPVAAYPRLSAADGPGRSKFRDWIETGGGASKIRPDRTDWVAPRCDLCTLARPGHGTVIQRTRVRRSMGESEIVAELEPGAVVFAEEVLGRSARVTEPHVGWVDVWSKSSGESVVVETPQVWMLPDPVRDFIGCLDRLKHLESQNAAMPVPSFNAVCQAWAALGGVWGGWNDIDQGLPCLRAGSAAQEHYLTKFEADHLWDHVTATEGGDVNFTSFCNSVQIGGKRRPGAWVVDVLHARQATTLWMVPEQFDFSADTRTNYCSQSRSEYCVPEVDGISRAHLDRSYHQLDAVQWSGPRTHWQDVLVTSFTPRTSPRAKPVVLFTMGLPGAGKSYCCNWLTCRQVLSADRFVRVDLDAIKPLLPEWRGYVEAREPASERTHAEASLIAELVLEEALEQGQHIWVDGTLQDVEYHSWLLRRIRCTFQDRTVVLLWVDAPEELCRTRCERRSPVPRQHWQRCVESLRAVGSTQLLRQCDAVLRVSNAVDDAPPVPCTWRTLAREGSRPREKYVDDWAELHAMFAG
eukprot:TRINITY_DN7792_c0_g1_i1.p1 TRINITY_DN7792_c0_g1~~TRINITY_DN7792_c0_g1_i1.p1  ORF type:complete len:560 (+),score=109.65 TRINITY_DN7792_c0_g1_i1:2-1681(+)